MKSVISVMLLFLIGINASDSDKSENTLESNSSAFNTLIDQVLSERLRFDPDKFEALLEKFEKEESETKN